MGAVSASVLATSPEELRLAARRLHALGGELEGLAGRVTSRAHPADGWGGVAAVQHHALTRRVAGLVQEASAPGEEVARTLEQVAQVAEDTSRRVVVGARRVEHGLAEIAALRAVGIPPEPHLAQAWRQRLADVEDEVARARSVVRDAEEEFELAQQRAAHVVGGAWAALQEALRLQTAVSGARRLARTLPWFTVHTVRTTRMVVDLVRSRWVREAAARAVALTRAGSTLQQLQLRMGRPPQGAGRLTRALFGPHPVAIAWSWFMALGDVRTGGGYAGWRGATTKALAGVALAGGVIAAGGLLVGGVVTPIGVLMVETYALWMAGNTIYDNRDVIVRYGGLAVRTGMDLARGVGAAAVRAGERAGARLRDLRTRALRTGQVVAFATGQQLRSVRESVGEVLAPLRDPRRWVIGLPPAVGGIDLPDLPEGLEGLVRQVPGSQMVRERLRQVGVPIRLPALPLGPVLRAPVDLGVPWSGAGG